MTNRKQALKHLEVEVYRFKNKVIDFEKDSNIFPLCVASSAFMIIKAYISALGANLWRIL